MTRMAQTAEKASGFKSQGAMPTSPLQKTAAIFGEFRRIRNIYKSADVGIGPY